MEKFEGQFENLDVQASSMDQAMSNTVTTFTPEDQVRGLMQEVASEAGLDLNTQIAVSSFYSFVILTSDRFLIYPLSRHIVRLQSEMRIL